jgi:uncharacterized protein YciI
MALRTHFIVVREAGPAWMEGAGIAGQENVEGHAAFMDALAADGFVLGAGPLAGTEEGRLRALLVVAAADVDEIHRRFAADPWAEAGLLVTTSVEPWLIFVGRERFEAELAGN